MEIWMYIVAGALLLFFGALIGVSIWRTKKPDGRVADDVELKRGVRYSTDEFIVEDDGSTKVSLVQGDIVIKKGETAIANKKGDFKPGKYTVLATNEGADALNIRVGSYVREFKHGAEIIVAEGESVCPVSTSIILR